MGLFILANMKKVRLYWIKDFLFCLKSAIIRTMSEKYKNYIVPAWISSRVYECNIDGEDVFKTFILNSKTHEYWSFEDNAAKLWSFVLNGDYEGLVGYAKENDLYDELDLFFEEIKQMGLISEVNDVKNNKVTYTQMAYQEDDNDDLEKFLETMSSWQYENGFLSSLLIELTYKCNLKCIHCYNDKDKQNKEITFEEIKPVIDDAIKLGVFSITLSGGESTIAKDFIKIARYIREKRLSLNIFTNGQFLYDNPNLLEELTSIYPSTIHISLYSMEECVHDKITGVKGSYKKTIAIINSLVERNFPICIKCFLTKYNIDAPSKLNMFAKELGVSITFDMTLLLNKDKSNKDVCVEISQMYDLYKNKYTLFHKSVPKFKDKKKLDLNRIICKGGQYFFCVDPFLDLYPCASLKVKFGNLRDTSLIDICSSKNTKLSSFRALRLSDLKECYEEDYCIYCSYCMGIATADNDYLKKSEISCAHAKAKMEIFNKL